jgi:hypothetical protein
LASSTDGRVNPARRVNIVTATTLYREMGLTYWLEQAEGQKASST